MSIPFNATATKKGLVQFYELEIGANYGDVTDNATKFLTFAAYCNLALDDFNDIALKASGKWQHDDSNHTDYPIITTNLVSGQRDYAFTTDENSNLILDIYKVLVADADGNFREIKSVDQQTPDGNNDNTVSFLDGQNTSGTPSRYDLTANAIFLDVIPNYNYTNGLKVLINREGSYFTSSDTTKKPGVPGIYHKYFYLKPAREYARINSLASFNRLDAEVQNLELDIENYYNSRQKGVARRLVANIENNK